MIPKILALIERIEKNLIEAEAADTNGGFGTSDFIRNARALMPELKAEARALVTPEVEKTETLPDGREHAGDDPNDHIPPEETEGEGDPPKETEQNGPPAPIEGSDPGDEHAPNEETA